ncbi:hypothetical protein Tco_1450301, partial [Tanacetum coccineum]
VMKFELPGSRGNDSRGSRKEDKGGYADAAIEDDLRMARTFFGTMSVRDKQLPLNRQEHTTQNELFIEISMDLQLTTKFRYLNEFFGPRPSYYTLMIYAILTET